MVTPPYHSNVSYYFAYGSNMNVERVREREMGFGAAFAGQLHGLALLFDKSSRQHAGAGHANVAYAPGSTVEGVVYRLNSPQEIIRMDPFENAPINYSREVVQITSSQGELSSWIYFANPAVCRAGLKPPRSYLNHLLAGKPFLSAGYYQVLQSWDALEGH